MEEIGDFIEESYVIRRAVTVSWAAHNAVGQVRKYTGEPYWEHPERVFVILEDTLKFKDDLHKETVLAAACLHDVVEDTHITLEQLSELFTQKIVNLVEMVTDVSKPEDGNRKARKKLDLEHLLKATGDGINIKLADLIDNTGSIVKHDKKFAKFYFKEKQDLLVALSESDIKYDEGLFDLCLKTLEDGLGELALEGGVK